MTHTVYAHSLHQPLIMKPFAPFYLIHTDMQHSALPVCRKENVFLMIGQAKELHSFAVS